MNKTKAISSVFGLLLTAAIVGVATSAFAEPSASGMQRNNRGGGGHASGGGNAGGGQQAHARREGVRTQNFVGRTQGGSFQQMPPVRQSVPPRTPPMNRSATTPSRARRPAPAQVVNQRTFTKTSSGRVYDNGLRLRKGTPVAGWQREYFPHGYVHFPFYRQTYIPGRCYYSPFSFYFGICLPYIDISACAVLPPPVNFIDFTAYDGTRCVGFTGADQYNMINDPDLDQKEPGLNNALDELTETFQGGNIDGIVSLINPNLQVAVFERNQYQYSLHANDYIDMTRDMIQSIQTVQFSLDYLHQRSPTVFCVSGQHVYNDKSGNSRSVYVTFVLQDIGGLWTLTQVGTSPDIAQ